MRSHRGYKFCTTTFCAVQFLLLSLATASGQEITVSVGPSYLMNTGSALFARPISTPIMSLQGSPLEVGAGNATEVLIPGAANQTELPSPAVALPKIDLLPIFYGGPPVSSIEFSFSKESEEVSRSNPLPASVSNDGIGPETTLEALRERGYGVTLGEAAAHERPLVRRALRVYTNADIDRLHGS